MQNDIIHLLPDSVANQIAAGEVIQRPSSVVKELVENAVDAGASVIKIVLKDAGRTLIQVIDNGSGMSETDARMAFERHSTSKISTASDLFSLSTMGFRGEALASIAAVAQVELCTMKKGAGIGSRICISGSKIELQEPDVCTPGSNMMVKNLFFNVPARRKFLKKDSVELSNILHEFERLALVNPGIEISLIHNENTLHQLLPGSLKQRIGQLFSKTVEKQLLPIDTATSIVKIHGFVGLPESARKRNWLQYFFVNGRNMRHPYFHKAIISCYEKLIGADVQPNYFINFEVDPATIDVNIHPTKNEIKFENEQSIWQILVAAVRESLGKFNVAPAIDFNADEAPEIPVFTNILTTELDIGEKPSNYNPFAPYDTTPTGNTTAVKRSGAIRSSALNKDRFSDWELLYSQWNKTENEPVQSEFSLNGNLSANNQLKSSDLFDNSEFSTSEMATVMQLKNKYIITPAKSGLLIIDQHRAHIRILYEDYITAVTADSPTSQSLIFPEILSLTPSQDIVLTELLPTLTQIGFDIAKMGTGKWAINGLPAIIADQNPTELLNTIIDISSEQSSNIKEDIKQSISLSMARTTAIKSGQSLTTEMMNHLIEKLFSLPTPTYTPDGLLVLKIIDIADLTRAF